MDGTLPNRDESDLPHSTISLNMFAYHWI